MEQSLPFSNLEHMLQDFEVHFLRSYGLEEQNTSLKDIPGRNNKYDLGGKVVVPNKHLNLIRHPF